MTFHYLSTSLDNSLFGPKFVLVYNNMVSASYWLTDSVFAFLLLFVEVFKYIKVYKLHKFAALCCGKGQPEPK